MFQTLCLGDVASTGGAVPPSNMQCQDMFLVQSVHVGKELTSDDDITGDLFEKVMKDKVVDVVKLPIVYVARDQFTH
jgi:hypothetical protein